MKIIKPILFGFIGILVLLLASILLLQHSHTLIALHTTQKNSLEFCMWRYSFIAIILICWSYWIRIISRLRHWDADLTEMLLKKRLWAGLFFISIEIFIWWGQQS